MWYFQWNWWFSWDVTDIQTMGIFQYGIFRWDQNGGKIGGESWRIPHEPWPVGPSGFESPKPGNGMVNWWVKGELLGEVDPWTELELVPVGSRDGFPIGLYWLYHGVFLAPSLDEILWTRAQLDLLASAATFFLIQPIYRPCYEFGLGRLISNPRHGRFSKRFLWSKLGWW